MEIILIIIASTMISALFCLSATLGYIVGIKKAEKKDNVVEVTKENHQMVKDMLEWMNYNGGRQ